MIPPRFFFLGSFGSELIYLEKELSGVAGVWDGGKGEERKPKCMLLYSDEADRGYSDWRGKGEEVLRAVKWNRRSSVVVVLRRSGEL